MSIRDWSNNKINGVIDENGEFVTVQGVHYTTIVNDYCMKHKSRKIRNKYILEGKVYDLEEICEETGYVAIGGKGYVGKPNKKQFATIRDFKIKGLYKGELRNLTVGEYILKEIEGSESKDFVEEKKV